MIIPRLRARRFQGRAGLRLAVSLLAIAALSLESPRVSAIDLSSQKKSSNEKPYALIFGTVWGPDNKPVHGVKVKIRRAGQKKAHWEVYSDHHGEFAQRVPAGKADYVVWADLKGYKPMGGNQLQPGDSATLHVEFDERVDTGLHLK